MPITTNAQKEDVAIAYGVSAPDASLHDADPGTTGADEISGGTPAYARVAITWNAGSVDGQIVSSPIEFDVPAGTTITHVGLWEGGTFKDKVAVAATFASQGVFRVVLTYTQS